MTRFLLVGDGPDDPGSHYWTALFREALESLGPLQAVSEDEISLIVGWPAFDLIIVDSAGVKDIPLLVTQLWAQWRRARIVVVTASPTWRQARAVLLAGAADYVRKSNDKRALRDAFEDILSRPAPRLPVAP